MRGFRFALVSFGFVSVVGGQALMGCSTAQCQECDKAGKLQWCTDCPTTDECTETISDKKSGEQLFTCTEAVGETCATDALLQYCDAL